MMREVQTVMLIAVALGMRYVVAISEGNRNIESGLREYTLEKRQADCINRYHTPGNCDGWAAGGQCDVNYTWMREFCQKSCGTCGCIDTHNVPSQCPVWAREGQCESNPAWMMDYCAKSCDSCGCEDTQTDCWDRAAKGDCVKSDTQQWMSQHCPISCATCKGKCLNGISKNNVFNDVSCEVWSRCGYCKPDYMYHQDVLAKCRKSCGLCGNNPTQIASDTCKDWLPKTFCIKTAREGNCNSPTELRGCMETCGGCRWLANKHEKECGFLKCAQWKSEGYCQSDPCFMNLFCGRVCSGRKCKNRKNFANSGPKPLCSATGTCL